MKLTQLFWHLIFPTKRKNPQICLILTFLRERARRVGVGGWESAEEAVVVGVSTIDRANRNARSSIEIGISADLNRTLRLIDTAASLSSSRDSELGWSLFTLGAAGNDVCLERWAGCRRSTDDCFCCWSSSFHVGGGTSIILWRKIKLLAD